MGACKGDANVRDKMKFNYFIIFILVWRYAMMVVVSRSAIFQSFLTLLRGIFSVSEGYHSFRQTNLISKMSNKLRTLFLFLLRYVPTLMCR